MNMNRWEKLVDRVLSPVLLPDFPYELDIREVVDKNNNTTIPYINIKIFVDSSKYHLAGPNFNEDYHVKLDEGIDDLITNRLDVVGLGDNINDMIYEQTNLEWTQPLSKMIQVEIENYIDDKELEYGRPLKNKPYYLGMTRNLRNPHLIINIRHVDTVTDKTVSTRRDLWEYLHSQLKISDFYIDFFGNN